MQEGCCLNCDAPGPVGQPCGERICQKRGYHYIPPEYWQKLQGETDNPVIGQVIDDYLIVDLLGVGGFGRVYLALQQPLLKLKGALKLMETRGLQPQQQSLFINKFKREGDALAELNHPNIVSLLKYGNQKNKPCLVMEYVDGGRTLASEFADRSMQGIGFESELIEHIIKQILDGLGAAHVLNIIHRDIKPENIMLQNIYGNPYFVRILDFGLAKFVEERSKTSAALGTPTYIAPEQIEMKNLGPWTDLYAVGIIVFELLTGRRPFAGDTFSELIAQKLNPSYDPVSQIYDLHFPEPLINFFRRALARDPNHRIRSASEFMEIFSLNMEILKSCTQVTVNLSLDELQKQEESQQLEWERKAIKKEREKLEAERQNLEAERREFSRQITSSDDVHTVVDLQSYDDLCSVEEIQVDDVNTLVDLQSYDDLYLVDEVQVDDVHTAVDLQSYDDLCSVDKIQVDDLCSVDEVRSDELISPPLIQIVSPVPEKTISIVHNPSEIKPENSYSKSLQIVGIIVLCSVLLMVSVSILVVKWDYITGENETEVIKKTDQPLTSAEPVINEKPEEQLVEIDLEANEVSKPEKQDSTEIKNQIESLFTQGRKAVEEENWQKAEEAFDSVLKLEPENEQARREWEQAGIEKPFKKIYKDTISMLEEQKYKDVIRYLKQIPPQSIYAERIKQDRILEKCYDGMLDKANNHINTKHWLKAIEITDEIIEENNDSDTPDQSVINRANKLKKQANKALKIKSDKQKSKPTELTAKEKKKKAKTILKKKCMPSLRSQNEKRIFTDCKEVLKYYNLHPAAVNVAKIYEHKGDIKNAIKYYKKALKVCPRGFVPGLKKKIEQLKHH